MLPFELRNRYFEVGALLSSNRALLDARRGISNLEHRFSQEDALLSDWRVEYVGVCALLRASIHLLQVDAKACHNENVTNELKGEWSLIKEEKDKHAIYWEFINKERNSILKEYHWTSYKQYFDEVGEPLEAKNLSLLTLFIAGKSASLTIKGGRYDGRKTIDVLKEAADWIEERIRTALSRAGYSINDNVHYWTWSRQPKLKGLDPTLGGER